jgi:VIT1/CCC1 family predicted Fe2+/Mn2+ transporter
MGQKGLVPEQHRSARIGWLRASVLGANDGVISTASLLVGIAAAHFAHDDLLIAGFAGMVAGAMSMAAGEYVSVSSQADTEKADLALEKYELETNIEFEREELTKIYIDRGLDPTLAKQVSQQLMAYDALGAHARDELGIFPSNAAQPLQAALASACFFSIGAAIPLLIVVIVPTEIIIPAVSGASLIFLATLGALAARVGGSSMCKGAIRVTFWGTLAMALTTGIGILHGGPV